MDAATTSSTGSYLDNYTYPATGTYTINATFQGSPTTLPPTSPGAGGIPGDYLLPCGPFHPVRMIDSLMGGLLLGQCIPSTCRPSCSTCRDAHNN